MDDAEEYAALSAPIAPWLEPPARSWWETGKIHLFDREWHLKTRGRL